jgi:hypothetical protein
VRAAAQVLPGHILETDLLYPDASLLCAKCRHASTYVRPDDASDDEAETEASGTIADLRSKLARVRQIRRVLKQKLDRRDASAAAAALVAAAVPVAATAQVRFDVVC